MKKRIYNTVLTTGIALCLLPIMLNANVTKGDDLHLNISAALQEKAGTILDLSKEDYDADEILVGVMESKTGKVLLLRSSNHYNPSHTTEKDIPSILQKFSNYPYEPGSVMKPITLALALDHNYTTPETWFNTYGGRMQVGEKRTISDDEKFDSLTVTDIVVHSSNIGISQIAWKLTGKEFRDGLIKFGISEPSGIDLGDDHPGKVKSLEKLNNKIHRANSSYGYGIHVTFAQLLKAYSAFNNDGVAVTPKLVDHAKDKKGQKYTLQETGSDLYSVNKKTANQIHDILLEVVKRGTGVRAQYSGLEIGGKTGTAHIVKDDRYVREYHSSFYGFANDAEGHKYTIGVLVIRAKAKYKYFASQSAVPIFKKLVQLLVDNDYLVPVQKESQDVKQK